MVVEDEPDIYEVLLAMFEMWGINGTAFVDGEEALAWIEDVDRGKFSGELPELALLDIRLPGLAQGDDVAKRLRESTALRNIAIVLTTAYKLSPPQYQQVIDRAGADKLMYKPLPKFNELKAQLEELIAVRKTQAHAEAPPAPVVEPPAPPMPPTPIVTPPVTPPTVLPPANPQSTTRARKSMSGRRPPRLSRKHTKTDPTPHPSTRPPAKDPKSDE